MTPPLFERVAFEKFLVELPADLADDDFLRVGRVFDGDAFFGEPSLQNLGMVIIGNDYRNPGLLVAQAV